MNDILLKEPQFILIQKSIVIVEKSTWQSHNTFFANCSKFFIGYAIHYNLYCDGAEKIR